ncbi:MAG: hypothetical protein J6A75_04310 [Lachnospiraceae bacterium]|nr:hypothetical protein [Lachnospiraceae bacterium]
MFNEIKEYETKICSRCGRELPLERFRSKRTVCKSCYSTYMSELNGFAVTEENIDKIERIYKEPIPQRILDATNVNIELVGTDE